MCVALPALDAMSEGCDGYHVVEVVRPTSVDGHRAALERVLQVGARRAIGVSLAGGLQRDWARQETMEDVIRIVPTERLLKE
jgi:hypothetical protein